MAIPIRKMYLAVPIIFGLSACSITRNMVFVNSPKDLEYKINTSNMTSEAIKNVQERMCHVNQNFVNTHYSTHYIDKKLIPYKSLEMNKPYKYDYHDFCIPKK